MAVTNDLVTDQRVHRIARTLSDADAEIFLIGRKFSWSDEVHAGRARVSRFRFLFNQGFLFYFFFNLRLFLYLLTRRKLHSIVSNDLDTLPACYLASQIRGTYLVYDSHEYFTEVPELVGRARAFVRNVWLLLESFLIPRVDYACTVNESLAAIFKNKYKCHFEVIRNVPSLEQCFPRTSLPEEAKGKRVIIYQGAINIGRGIEEMIDVVKDLEGVVFLIVGTGDIFREIQQKIEGEHLQQKVLLTGRFKPDILKSYTCQADLGVSLEQARGLNYYYALPNKIFDYIHAGIPVLSSDFPEMKRIVEGYSVGLTVNPNHKPEIRAVVQEMLFNEDKRMKWKENTAYAARENCWEIEQKRLISLYKKMGFIFTPSDSILSSAQEAKA